MRERIRRVLVALWLVAWTSACAAPPADGFVSDPSDFEPDRGRTDVRVALAFAAPSVTFEATGDVRVFAEGDRWRGSAGAYHATVRAGELVLTAPSGGRVEVKSKIDLRAADPAPWRFDGDRFAGSLTVRRNDDGTVSLVNTLPVETYLRGVVPWEIGRPGEDARAAVEAQAVAARTYTYARLGRWEEYGFDLHADVRDQVYRGLSGTAPICDEAIRATAHRVAVRDGALIRAYYSSTSGGHTATLVDVWHREGAPYLIGKRDADARGRSWCRTSPHFRWTESWSAKELGDIVREHLSSELDRSLAPEDIGVLQRIDVVARDHSGRVQRLAVVTDADRFEIWGDRIRWVLRPVGSRYGILRSTLFTVENVERDGRLVGVVLRGGGFGHGVGMCQTGALARARAGQGAGTILRAYYEGIDVVDVRSLDGWKLAR